MRLVKGDRRVYAPIVPRKFPDKLREIMESLVRFMRGCRSVTAPMSPIWLFCRLRERFERLGRLERDEKSLILFLLLFSSVFLAKSRDKLYKLTKCDREANRDWT